jgi:hypothetical protein
MIESHHVSAYHKIKGQIGGWNGVCERSKNLLKRRVNDEKKSRIIRIVMHHDPLRRLPPADVQVRSGNQPGQIELTNMSPVTAVGVYLIQRNAGELIHLDRNYLTLFPGEIVTVTSSNYPVVPEDFYLEGINL